MAVSNHWKFPSAFFHFLEVCALLVLTPVARPGDPPPTATLADPAGAWRAEPDERGGLRFLEFPRSNGWERTAFRTDAFRGPCWQLEEDGRWADIELKPVDVENRVYAGRHGDLRVGLRYEVIGSRLGILATVSNGSAATLGPLRAGLRLGLDCFRNQGTDWRKVYVPTLLRCEPTHFWGYFMSPEGRILGLSSPDPVASWHLDGEQGDGHARTASLDLLSARTLAAGETRIWTIYLEDIPRIEDIKTRLASSCRGPILAADPYTVEPGGRSVLRAHSSDRVTGIISTPAGGEVVLEFLGDGPGCWAAQLKLGTQPGAYEVRVRDGRGRQASTTLRVRHPWSWYLKSPVNSLPKEAPGLGDVQSLLAVMTEEGARARTSRVWKAHLEAHYAEVQGVLDNLLAEGVPPPEGGQLAVRAAQLGHFAMWVKDDKERQPYATAALRFMDLDRCFFPLLEPEPRITESTAARVLGRWYLYRLTGREELLRQAYEQLGAAVQQAEPSRGLNDCLGEFAVAACHVIERPGGTFVAYNGSARLADEVLVVEPAEPFVTGVHVNLRRPRMVKANLGGKLVTRRLETTGWLGRAP